MPNKKKSGNRVEFWFIINNSRWSWVKHLHVKHGNTLEQEIEDYLELKPLPFEELTRADISYKILSREI